MIIALHGGGTFEHKPHLFCIWTTVEEVGKLVGTFFYNSIPNIAICNNNTTRRTSPLLYVLLISCSVDARKYDAAAAAAAASSSILYVIIFAMC